MISKTLQHPAIFEWQQKVCNTYGTIREEFSTYYDQENLKILDIGCSTGTCAGEIVDMKKHRYLGIDIEAEYIERAQQLFPNGEFRVMDACNLDALDETFDLVTFNGVLHHMDDALIQKMAGSIQKVLKKDGVVIIGEPVFTKGKLISNFLLSLDRGRYIRNRSGYKKLFSGYELIREGYFHFSLHRFCSLVLKKEDGDAKHGKE